jgi:hypothetical protein
MAEIHRANRTPKELAEEAKQRGRRVNFRAPYRLGSNAAGVLMRPPERTVCELPNYLLSEVGRAPPVSCELRHRC